MVHIKLVGIEAKVTFLQICQIDRDKEKKPGQRQRKYYLHKLFCPGGVAHSTACIQSCCHRGRSPL